MCLPCAGRVFHTCSKFNRHNRKGGGTSALTPGRDIHMTLRNRFSSRSMKWCQRCFQQVNLEAVRGKAPAELPSSTPGWKPDQCKMGDKWMCKLKVKRKSTPEAGAHSPSPLDPDTPRPLLWMTHIPWGSRTPGTCPALAEQDQMGQDHILLWFGGWHCGHWVAWGYWWSCEHPLLEAPGLASVCRLWALGPVSFHFLLEWWDVF